MNFRNLLALLGALAVVTLLHACGGGKSSKSGDVRLVNLGDQTLDLRIAGTNIVGGVAAGTASAYVEREVGSSTFEIGAAGVAGTEFSVAGSVANNQAYTIVAYTTEKAIGAVFLSDGEAEPASGSAKFRVFNSGRESGSLDVYLTSANASLSGASPVNSNVGGLQVAGYATVNPGTYRVRVTGTGDKADLRLDIPAVTITDRQIATLVVTASDSGVLVNGALLNQGGVSTGYANAKVRLSVAADLTGGASVEVEMGGQPIVTSLASPQATTYLTVAADLSTLKVNGQLVTAAAAVRPGSDVTLLVRGDPAAPSVTVATDDNRLPGSSGQAVLRLAHGINGVPGLINLDQSSIFLVKSATLGAYSDPVEVSAGTDISYRVQAPSSTCAGAPWTKGSNTVTAGSVYTLFALGECTGTGLLVLRKDR